MIKPTDMMSDKRNKNADQAVKDALCMLRGNGFLTKPQADSCEAKIEKWEKDFYRSVNRGGDL